jgi:hypothetical protein
MPSKEEIVAKRIGRPFEVIEIPEGFVVEYVNFWDEKTQKPGETKEEAISNFLDYLEEMKIDLSENESADETGN